MKKVPRKLAIDVAMESAALAYHDCAELCRDLADNADDRFPDMERDDREAIVFIFSTLRDAFNEKARGVGKVEAAFAEKRFGFLQ